MFCPPALGQNQKRPFGNQFSDGFGVRFVVGHRRQDDQAGRQSAWLPGAPSVHQPRAVHNAAALAYMGDAIFEVITWLSTSVCVAMVFEVEDFVCVVNLIRHAVIFIRSFVGCVSKECSCTFADIF